ncbi:MAG TPA: hypothetical protein DDZ88_07755 [Verrucomicrobiales bacterium]|nr:hypothetical protein [Verrucomicrobiales bacterium]
MTPQMSLVPQIILSCAGGLALLMIVRAGVIYFFHRHTPRQARSYISMALGLTKAREWLKLAEVVLHKRR